MSFEKVEGFKQLSRKLSKLNIFHATGLMDIIKNSKKQICVYHPNVTDNFLEVLRNMIDDIKISLKYNGGLLLSSLIPLFVKRFIMNRSCKVIFTSEYVSKKFRLKNSEVIRIGIDVEKFKPIKMKDHELEVSYFGHVSASKGSLEVINAFSKLKGINKNMYLTDLNKKAKKYILNKDSTIKLYGFVDEIVPEYSKSDILVLPFRNKTAAVANPLVLLEAMACEKAIVTTDLPHIKEICGDSVVYVKPYSSNQIIKAINYLVKKPELRKELGKKARRKIIKDYNEKDMFIKYEKVLKRIK